MSKNLSRRGFARILGTSASYAALNPSNELWKLYLSEIDRVQKDGEISEADFNLLRFSTVARSAWSIAAARYSTPPKASARSRI